MRKNWSYELLWEELTLRRNKITKNWQNIAISESTKIIMVDALVFSVFSEMCRPSQSQKYCAFEMCCWHRMLPVFSTELTTHASITEELYTVKHMNFHQFKKIRQFLGFIKRRERQNPERSTSCNRPQKRAVNRWIDQTNKTTGLPLQLALRRANDRYGWRRLIKDSIVPRRCEWVDGDEDIQTRVGVVHIWLFYERTEYKDFASTRTWNTNTFCLLQRTVLHAILKLHFNNSGRIFPTR